MQRRARARVVDKDNTINKRRCRQKIKKRRRAAKHLHQKKTLEKYTTGDLEHVYLVGSFFRYCGLPWSAPVCEDISPKGLLGRPTGDPMYVVYATKLEA